MRHLLFLLLLIIACEKQDAIETPVPTALVEEPDPTPVCNYSFLSKDSEDVVRTEIDENGWEVTYVAKGYKLSYDTPNGAVDGYVTKAVYDTYVAGDCFDNFSEDIYTGVLEGYEWTVIPDAWRDDPVYGNIDYNDPYSFLEGFLLDAERHGYDVSHVDTSRFTFEIVDEPDGNFVARASGGAACAPDRDFHVTWNLKYHWDTYRDGDRKYFLYVFWHEFGHSIISLGHNCSFAEADPGIMTSGCSSTPGVTNPINKIALFKGWDKWTEAVDDLFSGKEQNRGCYLSKTPFTNYTAHNQDKIEFSVGTTTNKLGDVIYHYNYPLNPTPTTWMTFPSGIRIKVWHSRYAVKNENGEVYYSPYNLHRTINRTYTDHYFGAFNPVYVKDESLESGTNINIDFNLINTLDKHREGKNLVEENWLKALELSGYVYTDISWVTIAQKMDGFDPDRLQHYGSHQLFFNGFEGFTPEKISAALIAMSEKFPEEITSKTIQDGECGNNELKLDK